MIKQIFNSSLSVSGIYTITSGINAAIPFANADTNPIPNPIDYGTVAMFGVLLSFVAPFTGLSINGAIARQYYASNSRHASLCK